MTKFLALGLFAVLARLPLPWLHGLGGWLGQLVFRLSRRYATRLRDNLALAYGHLPRAEFDRLLWANVREMGKSVLELPWLWRRPLPEVLAKVRACQGLPALQAAHAAGRGVVVLTPHLGCFEIASLYLGSFVPATCLYQESRYPWLERLMRQGRTRGGVRLAPADRSGVRQLYRALKQGEAIGILPDQVPGKGEGEWLPFFGRPAYTMTLAARLIESSSAAVFLAFAERLPQGRGYDIHLFPLALEHTAPLGPQLNRAVEELVRRCPAQYLWSYNRYKLPRGVLPPAEVQA